MLKKIKDFFRKVLQNETFAIIAIALIMVFSMSFCYLCSYTSALKEQEKEAQLKKPEYVQVHYGNGEIYQFKAKSVAKGREMTPIVILENGYVYNFSESYTYKILDDSNQETWHIYLWRDLPYQLEKELFTKIN